MHQVFHGAGDSAQIGSGALLRALILILRAHLTRAATTFGRRAGHAEAYDQAGLRVVASVGIWSG
ncbi:hypothetical protein GCM10022223_08880 [Kineosporia mesophila]|uniref:Uncharacterized protein n=1 Tax=Kineosporia mesophila TaxID=566012 RepID=A0ABP6Z4N0_9ACTN